MDQERKERVISRITQVHPMYELKVNRYSFGDLGIDVTPIQWLDSHENFKLDLTTARLLLDPDVQDHPRGYDSSFELDILDPEKEIEEYYSAAEAGGYHVLTLSVVPALNLDLGYEWYFRLIPHGKPIKPMEWYPPLPWVPTPEEQDRIQRLIKEPIHTRYTQSLIYTADRDDQKEAKREERRERRRGRKDHKRGKSSKPITRTHTSREPRHQQFRERLASGTENLPSRKIRAVTSMKDVRREVRALEEAWSSSSQEWLTLVLRTEGVELEVSFTVHKDAPDGFYRLRLDKTEDGLDYAFSRDEVYDWVRENTKL
jgi:hypothetical protein